MQSHSECSDGFEHVDAFSDYEDSSNCRVLNTTADTHDTANIQLRLSLCSQSTSPCSELHDSKFCFACTCMCMAGHYLSITGSHRAYPAG